MNFTELGLLLDKMHSDYQIPCCEISVAHKGKEVYYHGAGFEDYDKKIAVSSNGMYYLYSSSKVTLATASMIAMEQGLFTLDTKVGDILPKFKTLFLKDSGDIPQPAKTPLTVLHLLTMHGGFDYNFRTPATFNAIKNGETTTLQLVDKFAEAGVCFEPGEKFQYSVCHDIMAAVIEKASGIRYRDYVQKYIFDPLEMTDSTFKNDEETRKRLIAQYWYNYRDDSMNHQQMDCEFILTPDYDSGGAGIISTCRSYAKLAAALANGGVGGNGTRILTEKSIAEMSKNRMSHSVQIEFSRSWTPGYGYGLGVRTLLDPFFAISKTSVGEFGWDGAAGSYMFCDPKRQLSVFYTEHIRNDNNSFREQLIRNTTVECFEK